MKKSICLRYFTFLFLLLISCTKEEENPPLVDTNCMLTDLEASVVADLNSEYAHRFNSSNPEIEDNLMEMINYIGDTKFVGLGESTHGTLEFFEMKDKIFRNLVEKKGFKAIIFELPWGNALRVNDYVRDNISDVNSVIDQTLYWVYDTEEVRKLAEWINNYNASVPRSEHVHFVGCDVQGIDFVKEMELLSNYLEIVEPDSLDMIMNLYNKLPEQIEGYADEPQSLHNENIKNTKRVYDFILSNRDKFIAASNEYDYEVVLMATHVIKEREYVYRAEDYGLYRDELMAFYSKWWQRILGSDSKLAIWAHNGHVSKGFGSMGGFLEGVPEDYKNVGFSFGKGSANAFVAKFDRSSSGVGVKSQVINSFPCNTSNFVMSEVDADQFYLIFDELELVSEAYFNSAQPFLEFGAGFNPLFLNNYIFDKSLSQRFDVLVHFDEAQSSVLK